MRNPEKNTIIILYSLIHEGVIKSYESLIGLIRGKKPGKNGVIWSMMHESLIVGPRKWKKSPNTIMIGRGWIQPLLFLFSHTSAHADSKKNK